MSNDLIGTIPLANMLEALRLELIKAVRRSDSELKLAVEKIEVELQIQVEKTTTGKGEIKFWVLTAGGEHTAGRSSVHTLKLQLKPSFRGARLEVSDQTTERPE